MKHWGAALLFRNPQRCRNARALTDLSVAGGDGDKPSAELPVTGLNSPDQAAPMFHLPSKP